VTLQLLTTDDLVAELKRRYPLLVILGSADVSEDSRCELICYNGTFEELNLALDVAKVDLMEQYREGVEEARDNP